MVYIAVYAFMSKIPSLEMEDIDSLHRQKIQPESECIHSSGHRHSLDIKGQVVREVGISGLRDK